MDSSWVSGEGNGDEVWVQKMDDTPWLVNLGGSPTMVPTVNPSP